MAKRQFKILRDSTATPEIEGAKEIVQSIQKTEDAITLAEAFEQPGKRFNEGLSKIAEGNIGEGAVNIGESILALGGVADEAIRRIPIVGEPISDVLNAPFTLYNEANQLVDSGLTKLGLTEEQKRLGLDEETANVVKSGLDIVNQVGVGILAGKASAGLKKKFDVPELKVIKESPQNLVDESELSRIQTDAELQRVAGERPVIQRQPQPLRSDVPTESFMGGVTNPLTGDVNPKYLRSERDLFQNVERLRATERPSDIIIKNTELPLRSSGSLPEEKILALEKNQDLINRIFELREIRKSKKPDRQGKTKAGKDLTSLQEELNAKIPGAKYNLTNNELTIDGKKVFPVKIEGEIKSQKLPEQEYQQFINDGLRKGTLSGKAEELAESAVKYKDSIKKSLRDIITPVTTQLGQIDRRLKYDALRRFEYDNGVKKIKNLTETELFLEKYKTLPKEDALRLDFARLNGDESVVKNISDKYNLESELNQVRKTIDNLSDELGIERRLREYHPRMVRDHDGFVEYFENLSDNNYRNVFKDVIKKREDAIGRKLTKEESANLINNALRGYNPNIRLGKISAEKDRVLDVIKADVAKFYHDPNTSLVKFIDQATDAVTQRKFFGKEADESSIGELVLNLIKDKNLNYKEVKEAKDLLQARFNMTPTSKGVSTLKSSIYIMKIANPISAIKQIGDLAVALYKTDLKSTSKALADIIGKKNKITLDDVGIESNKLAQEFGNVGNRQKSLDWMLKRTGFSTIDRLGKNTLINAVFDNFQKRALKPDADFNRRLQNVFGNETGQVIDDLKAGRSSENVKYLLFNELLDTQPIALSEMPPSYLRSNGGRVFYALKTFFIRRLDFFRNETFNLMKTDPKEGLKNLVKLTGTIALMETGTDQVINMLLKGEPIAMEDAVVDNVLKIGGLSRWNLTDAERGGTGNAIVNLVAPPVDAIDNVGELIIKPLKGKTPNINKLSKNIPVVGRIYYNWFGRDNSNQDKYSTNKILERSSLKREFKIQKLER